MMALVIHQNDYVLVRVIVAILSNLLEAEGAQPDRQLLFLATALLLRLLGIEGDGSERVYGAFENQLHRRLS